MFRKFTKRNRFLRIILPCILILSVIVTCLLDSFSAEALYSLVHLRGMRMGTLAACDPVYRTQHSVSGVDPTVATQVMVYDYEGITGSETNYTTWYRVKDTKTLETLLASDTENKGIKILLGCESYNTTSSYETSKHPQTFYLSSDPAMKTVYYNQTTWKYESDSKGNVDFSKMVARSTVAGRSLGRVYTHFGYENSKIEQGNALKEYYTNTDADVMITRNTQPSFILHKDTANTGKYQLERYKDGAGTGEYVSFYSQAISGSGTPQTPYEAVQLFNCVQYGQRNYNFTFLNPYTYFQSKTSYNYEVRSKQFASFDLSVHDDGLFLFNCGSTVTDVFYGTTDQTANIKIFGAAEYHDPRSTAGKNLPETGKIYINYNLMGSDYGWSIMGCASKEKVTGYDETWSNISRMWSSSVNTFYDYYHLTSTHYFSYADIYNKKAINEIHTVTTTYADVSSKMKLWVGIDGIPEDALKMTTGGTAITTGTLTASGTTFANTTKQLSDYTISASSSNTSGVYSIANQSVYYVPAGQTLTVAESGVLIVGRNSALILSGTLLNYGSVIVQPGGMILYYQMEKNQESAIINCEGSNFILRSGGKVRVKRFSTGADQNYDLIHQKYIYEGDISEAFFQAEKKEYPNLDWATWEASRAKTKEELNTLDRTWVNSSTLKAEYDNVNKYYVLAGYSLTYTEYYYWQRYRALYSLEVGKPDVSDSAKLALFEKCYYARYFPSNPRTTTVDINGVVLATQELYLGANTDLTVRKDSLIDRANIISSLEVTALTDTASTWKKDSSLTTTLEWSGAGSLGSYRYPDPDSSVKMTFIGGGKLIVNGKTYSKNKN